MVNSKIGGEESAGGDVFVFVPNCTKLEGERETAEKGVELGVASTDGDGRMVSAHSESDHLEFMQFQTLIEERELE